MIKLFITLMYQFIISLFRRPAAKEVILEEDCIDDDDTECFFDTVPSALPWPTCATCCLPTDTASWDEAYAEGFIYKRSCVCRKKE